MNEGSNNIVNRVLFTASHVSNVETLPHPDVPPRQLLYVVFCLTNILAKRYGSPACSVAITVFSSDLEIFDINTVSRQNQRSKQLKKSRANSGIA